MPIIDETNYNYVLKADDKEYQNKLNEISLHHLKLDRVAKYILYMVVMILFIIFIIYSIWYIKELFNLVQTSQYALINIGVFTSISAIFVYTFLFKLITYIFKTGNTSNPINNDSLNNLYNNLKDFFINNDK